MSRHGDPVKIKGTLKEGENVPVYKDKLMIIKWKDRKDICLMCITRDDKVVLTVFQGQDMARTIVLCSSTVALYRGKEVGTII
jgi:hypothetical protein